MSEITDVRASLGYVKDYYATLKYGSKELTPNPSKSVYDTFLSIYEKDPIVAAAVDVVSEETTRNKGYFVGSKRATEQATKLFDEVDFYRVSEIVVRTQHIYGDAFVEFVTGDTGSVTELHCLETTEMFINYNVHGEILGYEQRPFTVSGTTLRADTISKYWSPEQILFLPLKKLGSKTHSYSPLNPALKAILIRSYAHSHIEGVFKNFKPQVIYSIPENTSELQVKSLISAIQAADKDPSRKILSIGDVEVKNTGLYDFKSDAVDWLNYFRQEILATTRVPGVYVGITADSNRGVGEFEANAFQSHILKVQRDLEKLGNELLKKNNIKATFRMKPPSLKSQTDIIQQAQKLKEMGYGDSVITPFLFNNGIDVPIEAVFEHEEQKSMDSYPSREKSDKSVTEKYNLGETGRSEAGMKKQQEMDKVAR